MKFYSEVTKELYDTPEQLAAAELKFNNQNVAKRIVKPAKNEKNPEVPSK